MITAAQQERLAMARTERDAKEKVFVEALRDEQDRLMVLMVAWGEAEVLVRKIERIKVLLDLYNG
jgi:hypothetical protein